MTLPIERARTRKPITWLTIIGVILLPVVIGGILVAALYNPTDRLGNMRAAIVNDDKPVTLGGQTVPLGRQLTAGLVKGSDDLPSNIDWSITNADEAASGMADGTYNAVVTIPENFSAAATSTAGAAPEQALIQVATPPGSRIVDDAITAQVAQAAASLTGQQLSKGYLENVFVGFTSLHDQLGKAADGADQLASGAAQSATGATQLASGVHQLSDGAAQLATGAGQAATGVSTLADGAAQLAGGATQAANGVSTLATNAQALSQPAQILATSLGQLSAATAGVQIPQNVIDAANNVAANSDQLQQQAAATAAQLTQAAADCPGQGSTPAFCATLTQLAQQANAALPRVDAILANSQTIADGMGQINQLPGQTQQLAQLGDVVSQGVTGIAGGLQQAAGGVGAVSTGADGLASGARQAAAGVQQVATGASGLATGLDATATGADGLAGGIQKLADGTSSLASGLHTAAGQIPTYTDAQATSLASVVANPVAATGTGTSLFGASAIPLLATLALWFGGLASFIVLRAMPARALASRRPSALLALRALLPGAVVGAVQGLLVAVIVEVTAAYDMGTWSLFALLCVAAGIAFAAINQALVAVLGGAGRWVSALVGVLAASVGIVSTVPAWLLSLAGFMPTAPAYTAMIGILTPAGGVGAAVAGLVIWALLAFLATVLAVTRRRTLSARALLSPRPVS